MSEYNINEKPGTDETEIKNKVSLDKEKIVDRVLVSVLIVFCIVLTILGIDIEKKLKVINEREPIVISQQTTIRPEETSDTTQATIPESVYETTSAEVITTSAPEQNTESPLAAATTLNNTTTTQTTTQETTTTVKTSETQTTPPSETTTQTATKTPATTIPTSSPVTSEKTTTATTTKRVVKQTTEHTEEISTEKQTTRQTVPETTKIQSDGKHYITASGTKYHISTCSYLSKSKIEIELDEAIEKGYLPCSRCIE